MAPAPLLSCRGITKTYESNHVKACSGINLDLYPGKIHCILGENGAGKSTLMRILTGDQHADEGSIFVRGERASFSSPHDALSRGIGMIHQQSNMIPGFSVWENIILGSEETPMLGRLRIAGRTKQNISSLCSSYGISIPLKAQSAGLDSSGIQTAALLSLLHRNCDILIFDEPHSMFSGDPPRSFTELAREFAREGKAVVVVTHNLEAAFDMASSITILRRGFAVGTYCPGEVDVRGATRLMMGLPPEFVQQEYRKPSPKRSRSRAAATPMLEVKSVTTDGDPQDPSRLRDVSFDLYPGEILACVGIKEHGLITLERLLSSFVPGQHAELPRLTAGSIHASGIGELPLPLHVMRSRGMGYVPSDRLTSASAVHSTLQENAVIHVHSRLTGTFPGMIDPHAAGAYAQKLIKSLSIHGRPEDKLVSLSGGNIQKLIAARELALRPKLLIACEITWGLDVMTQEFLFDQMKELKRSGGSVLLLTSEADAALQHADRIALFHQGRLVSIDSAEGLTPGEVGSAILRGEVR